MQLINPVYTSLSCIAPWKVDCASAFLHHVRTHMLGFWWWIGGLVGWFLIFLSDNHVSVLFRYLSYFSTEVTKHHDGSNL